MSTMKMTSRSSRALEALWHRWTQLAVGYALAPADPPAAGALQHLIEQAFKRLEAGADDEAFVTWACARVPWLAAALGDAPRLPPPLPPRWVPPPTPQAAAIGARLAKAAKDG